VVLSLFVFAPHSPSFTGFGGRSFFSFFGAFSLFSFGAFGLCIFWGFFHTFGCGFRAFFVEQFHKVFLSLKTLLFGAFS